MPRSEQWKEHERSTSEIWGAYRVALSGGNSGGTRSDSDHPDLFLEVKANKSVLAETARIFRAASLRAKKGGRCPMLVLYKKGDKTDKELLVVPLDLFQEMYSESGGRDLHVEYVVLRKQSAVYTLMEKVIPLAAEEKKTPALAFRKGCCKGGLLIFRRADGIGVFRKAYEERFQTRARLNKTRPVALRRELDA